MEKWMKEIALSDMDEKNREIAEIIGVESYLKLIEFYGGTRVYFNKLEEVTKSIRDKKIREEYNRYNIRELTVKYNLAEESVRRILRSEPAEGQISIFD